jgi:hypothetical protein
MQSNLLSRKKVIVIVVFIILSIITVMEIRHQVEIRQINNDHSTNIQILNGVILSYEQSTERLNAEINMKEDTIFQLQNLLVDTNASLSQNVSELKKLRYGSWYTQHDPTYLEVVRFIQKDTTDLFTYNETYFNCMYFAQYVDINVERQGIRCALVVLYFNGTDAGHAIVGFNTSDKGMVYVEPQSDEWVQNLVVGNDFWTDCIVPNGDYYYDETSNDTIREILVFW